MERSWIINGRGLSRKVKNVSAPASCQIKDSGAKLECPYCHQTIDNSDVSDDWAGLPVGVKFDPSDVELLEHLAVKCGVGNLKPHSFIDEFIPTLEGHEGICYTHPENLPGAKKDGSSIHFFYQTFNAYATGRRKRRKIQDEEGLIKESVRWHKTGKTKTLLVNGVQKGYKKIMVLYSSSKNGRKAAKCSWVMHQYHLGAGEDEKEGEYVVCKIFYQPPRQTENNETSVLAEESDTGPTRSPKTPKTTTPQPFQPVNTPFCDDIVTGHVIGSPKEEMDFFPWNGQDEYTLLAGESQAIEEDGSSNTLFYNIAHDDISLDAQIIDEHGYTTLLGESQAIEEDGSSNTLFYNIAHDDISLDAQIIDEHGYTTLPGEGAELNEISDFLMCNEMIHPWVASSPGLSFEFPTDAVGNTNHIQHGDCNAPCNIAALENLMFDTPPDPADLPIISQESILDWWNKL